MSRVETETSFHRTTRIWHTVQFRFSLWTAGLLFVALVIFGCLVYMSVSRGLLAAVDQTLHISAAQAAASVEVANGQLDLPERFIEQPENVDFLAEGLMLRLLTPDGQLVMTYGQGSAVPVIDSSLQSAHHLRDNLTTLSLPDQPEMRIYTLPVENNARLVGIIQVAQSLKDVQTALSRLMAALLISIPALVIVAGIGGYALAAHALAPIDEMVGTARLISAEDLSARLTLPHTEDEIGRLATTLNGMLARLDNAFQRERQFTADASHELRTPLTAMQAILDVTQARTRTVGEYEQALDDLGEETYRLRHLTESLLLLARGEGRQRCQWETINLSALLDDVVESLRPLAKDKGLLMSYSASTGLIVMGNSDDLVRMLLNLLDNAIKYTKLGSIVLSAGQRSKSVWIEIKDTGCGIAPENIAHVFDRFYRTETSRTTAGTGLGLPIALQIAQAHGGFINVTSELSKGTTFTVFLPLKVRKTGKEAAIPD
jgi:heavy metal sensor kinase